MTQPAPDIATLTAELESLREQSKQWETNWHDAGDYMLAKEALEGKPVMPPPGSLSEKVCELMRELERQRQEIAALENIVDIADVAAQRLDEALNGHRVDRNAHCAGEYALDLKEISEQVVSSLAAQSQPCDGKKE